MTDDHREALDLWRRIRAIPPDAGIQAWYEATGASTLSKARVVIHDAANVLANAYAEEHQEDDAGPVTVSMLVGAGFVFDPGTHLDMVRECAPSVFLRLIPKRIRLDVVMESDWFIAGYKDRLGMPLPWPLHPKTAGDVRRLLRALKIDVKEDK